MSNNNPRDGFDSGKLCAENETLRDGIAKLDFECMRKDAEIELLRGFLHNLLDPEITVDETFVRRARVRQALAGGEE